MTQRMAHRATDSSWRRPRWAAILRELLSLADSKPRLHPHAPERHDDRGKWLLKSTHCERVVPSHRDDVSAQAPARGDAEHQRQSLAMDLDSVDRDAEGCCDAREIIVLGQDLGDAGDGWREPEHGLQHGV
jgi:hypothetical protein